MAYFFILSLKKRRTVKIFRFFPLVLSLLIATSCQKSTEQSTKRDADSFLHISFQFEVRSLDPRIGIDFPSAFAVKMLFEGLMRMGPSGNIEPAIAKSYALSDDYMTYTFYLKDAQWSNGDSVTADDFAYAWKRIINPDEGDSLGVQNLYPIKNTRAIIRGEKTLDSVGIRVIDDKTLQVELEHPTPYFLEVLSTSSLFPVNARVDRENPDWANQDGSAFVCNGPFTLKRHRIDNEIIVEKNPLYWDEVHVKMPGIHIAIIKDATTQMNMFEKEKLEWLGKPLSKLPIDAIDYLKQEDKVRFFETLGIYWFFVNVESFPFNNKKMRKAFAYAIDRQALTQFVTQGRETPATGVLPHSLATQEEPYFQDNNLELAHQLFNEALEEMGLTEDQLPEITVNYADAPVHQRVAEALQQQWNKAFGLNITLEKQEWKVHYGKLQKGNFQIGGMAWQSWLRDPIYIMQTFREKADGVNMSQWENEEYQGFLSAAEQEVDPVKRKAYFNKAEALLMEEMPVIPVYFTTIAYAKSDRLENVYISELYEVDFRWSYFNETR